MEKVDNKEFGIPKGLITIVYAETTSWKIIYIIVRKDKHVSHGVGKYMIASLTGARKGSWKGPSRLICKFHWKII
jgi:hypothetical protein